MPFDPRRGAGLLLFLATAQFAVGLTAAAALTPGYSIADEFLSDLGVREAAPVFNGSVLLLGILLVVTAYLLHRVYGRHWVTAPVLLAGVGAAGVDVFTEDVPTLHGLFALLAFVAGGLAALLVAWVLRQPLRTLSLVLGALSLVALVLFLAGVHLGLGHGGMERMIVLPVLAWGMGLGGYLMAAPEAGAGP